MDNIIYEKRKNVIQMAVLFCTAFFAAVPAAAAMTGEWADLLPGFLRILSSPCPLVTDYYRLGNLPAAFLNAAVCGSVCVAFLSLSGGDVKAAEWAGFFLVVAHCFYGLNFVNMWPPILGIFLFCKVKGFRFRENLDMAMFSTAFGPFFSELLFRYPLADSAMIGIGPLVFPIRGLIFCVILGLILAFLIPAMLPGAYKIHHGFNLYNGGLAFGILGLLLYSFLFRTQGVETPSAVVAENAVYEANGSSYSLFCNLFFGIVFGLCILIGRIKDKNSIRTYGELLEDAGYRVSFFERYGCARVWVNLGVYGLMMLAYFDLVIALTDGAGFTGATCGVTLAAMTFAASGQHPKNVWPILAGYVLLFFGVAGLHLLNGTNLPWTLSTQGYMNGVAFATGLCPFAGKYGIRVGIAAGFLSAVMCTTTSLMHGGFVLYNGGLTAGLAAIILMPILEFYGIQARK